MTLEEVYNKIEQNKDASIDLLCELLKIPSIAAKETGGPEAIEFLSKYFEEAGFTYFLAETSGNPVFCAEMNVGADKTLLFYDHYDVQPEDPIDLWDSPPFEPTIRNGKIFARGVSDNKGEIICRLQAIKAYNEVFGKPPVNVKFVIEGEEEVGSPNLEEFVNNNKKFINDADGCIWEFGGRDGDGIQEVYLGVKGILYLHLKTNTIGRDVHSGYTQFVNNAAYEMSWALASLKDRNDRILVPGFYDNIPEPSPEDMKIIEDFNLKENLFKENFGVDNFRLNLTGLDMKKKYFLEPTCNICGLWSGYQGPGGKTVTPNEAFAKVDFRLVPGQDATDLVAKIRKFWDDNGFQHIEITSWDGYPAAQTSINDSFAKQVVDTIKDIENHEPVIWPMVGGSGPMYLFEGVPCISIGCGHANANAHAPNENIFIDDFVIGMKTIANLIHLF
ncbi:MAG: M20/M25/M40 family metallo-hydrolase [Candidatus Heimdallarchaeaceae archaeon]